MINMTNKEYSDILNMIYTVNCCEDKESFIDTLMPSIMQMFDTECATFHLVKGYPQHIKIVESRAFKCDKNNFNEDKVYPGLYKDSFYHHSPLLQEAISSSKVILKIGESISLKDWERSNLYNNFILPQHLYWELFVTLRWKNNLKGMITLWRSRQEGEYEDGDMSKAGMLAPHLAVAVHKMNVISKLNNWQQHFLPAEVNGEGTILLDHKLKPLYFNTNARQICLNLNPGTQIEYSGQEDNDFPIPACIIEDCTDLLESLKTGKQTLIWPKERIVVSENNRRFHVECSLIWKAGYINSQPNFVVILRDLKDDQNSETSLQTKFNLSKRELDIIYCLVKGMSCGEIAENLYISKLTVNTHVKNIYRKLGARNRIELYRYVQPSSRLE